MNKMLMHGILKIITASLYTSYRKRLYFKLKSTERNKKIPQTLLFAVKFKSARRDSNIK